MSELPGVRKVLSGSEPAHVFSLATIAVVRYPCGCDGADADAIRSADRIAVAGADASSGDVLARKVGRYTPKRRSPQRDPERTVPPIAAAARAACFGCRSRSARTRETLSDPTIYASTNCLSVRRAVGPIGSL